MFFIRWAVFVIWLFDLAQVPARSAARDRQQEAGSTGIHAKGFERNARHVGERDGRGRGGGGEASIVVSGTWS